LLGGDKGGARFPLLTSFTIQSDTTRYISSAAKIQIFAVAKYSVS